MEKRKVIIIGICLLIIPFVVAEEPIWKKGTYDMIDVCYDYPKYLSCTEKDIEYLKDKFYFYYYIDYDKEQTYTMWANWFEIFDGEMKIWYNRYNTTQIEEIYNAGVGLTNPYISSII